MFSDLEKTKSKFRSKSVERRVTALAPRHNYLSHKASCELRSRVNRNMGQNTDETTICDRLQRVEGKASSAPNKNRKQVCFYRRWVRAQKWQWWGLINSSNTRPGWVIQKTLIIKQGKAGHTWRPGIHTGWRQENSRSSSQLAEVKG